MKRTRSSRVARFMVELDAATPALVARCGGKCEIGVPRVCAGRGSERHHRRRRNVRDPHSNDLENLLWACQACHAWAHAHGTLARGHGWIVS